MTNPQQPIYLIYRDGVPMAWRQTKQEAETLVDKLVQNAELYFDKSPLTQRITHGQEHGSDPILFEHTVYAQQLAQQWWNVPGWPRPVVVFTCRRVPYEPTWFASKQEEVQDDEDDFELKD